MTLPQSRIDVAVIGLALLGFVPRLNLLNAA